jgi:hypothetical protein
VPATLVYVGLDQLAARRSDRFFAMSMAHGHLLSAM